MTCIGMGVQPVGRGEERDGGLAGGRRGGVRRSADGGGVGREARRADAGRVVRRHGPAVAAAEAVGRARVNPHAEGVAVEIDEAILASIRVRAEATLRQHVDAINAGDEQNAMANLVAARQFPEAASVYWRKALEVRPLSLCELRTREPRLRVRAGRAQVLVKIEGRLSAGSGRTAPFGFPVLFDLTSRQLRIAGRLPVHNVLRPVWTT
jgi:hypothetical protein